MARPVYTDYDRGRIVAGITAAVQQGSTVAAACVTFGVPPKTYRYWRSRPDGLEFDAMARSMAAVVARPASRTGPVPAPPASGLDARGPTAGEAVRAQLAAAAPKVVPIRPNMATLPAIALTDQCDDSLIERAMAVLHEALQAGDPQTARWVLERLRPSAFGSAADKRVMHDLAKSVAGSESARVVVTIAGARSRKQAAG